MNNPITVQTTVTAPLEKVWEFWNGIEHISGWAFASDDWGAEPIKNDLQVGGTFSTRMFAKDGSVSFDFAGTYTTVTKNRLIEYSLDDGRYVTIEFEETSVGTLIRETFDPENENPAEMQRAGWQAFLDNFKSYVESK